MTIKPVKATSIDIAHRAKVSQATVSRALRNSPLVRPETRLRIQQIADEMHYRVDRSAAGLRTRRSRTLALLLFEEYPNEAQINPFFLNMLGHITHTASRRGFDLLVSFQQQSEDWHTDYQLSNRADGLILLGYGDYTTYAERLRRLTDSGTHFVIWGPVIEDLRGHYLGCAHTQANFETAFYRSNIADNNSFEQWLAEGEQDAAKRANTLYKRMLREFEAPALDPAIDEALLAFIGKRKAAEPDSNV